MRTVNVKNVRMDSDIDSLERSLLKKENRLFLLIKGIDNYNKGIETLTEMADNLSDEIEDLRIKIKESNEG